MPLLDQSADRTSFFEFWPRVAFYWPSFFYWTWLGMTHRGGGALPTISNPALPFSGLVGESKIDILQHIASGDAAAWAPAFCTLSPGVEGQEARVTSASACLKRVGISYPFVAKPDVGCRGMGVQLIRDEAGLARYIEEFKADEGIIFQELVDSDGEAGVFYLRHPDHEKGIIPSLTLKYFPHVVGDGQSTLEQLIHNNPRAGKLVHIYLDRHRARLSEVPRAGEAVRLAFAGSHSRGSIFRDGNAYVTQAMTDSFDTIARSLGDFYIGRFDVRFDDFEALRRGEGFKILEINGAGAEMTHIWDSRTSLPHAWAVMNKTIKALFDIGVANRKRGHKPATVSQIVTAYLQEQRLVGDYPPTH